MPSILVQIIGYLAPAFLAASFLFKKADTIRWVNSIGCLLFIVYGLCISAYPVVIANVVIVAINAHYFIFKRRKNHD